MSCSYIQEVPAHHETKRVVHPFAGQADEATADGVRGAHLCDAVVDHGQDAALNGVRYQQVAGTAIVESRSDAHEERRSNRSPNGDKLDLAIGEVPLQLVCVVGDGAFLEVIIARASVDHEIRPGRDVGGLFIVVAAEESHCCAFGGRVEWGFLPFTALCSVLGVLRCAQVCSGAFGCTVVGSKGRIATGEAHRRVTVG